MATILTTDRRPEPPARERKPVPLQVYPANGVPWLVWLDRQSWRCQACGRAGRLPPYTTVASFAKALGDLKRVHHDCGADGDGDRVGDPLNPHRAER